MGQQWRLLWHTLHVETPGWTLLWANYESRLNMTSCHLPRSCPGSEPPHSWSSTQRGLELHGDTSALLGGGWAACPCCRACWCPSLSVLWIILSMSCPRPRESPQPWCLTRTFWTWHRDLFEPALLPASVGVLSMETKPLSACFELLIPSYSSFPAPLCQSCSLVSLPVCEDLLPPCQLQVSNLLLHPSHQLCLVLCSFPSDHEKLIPSAFLHKTRQVF